MDFFPPADGTIVKTVQVTKLLSPKERTTASSNAATVKRVPNSQENTDSITQETGVTDEAESLSRACKSRYQKKGFFYKSFVNVCTSSAG